MSIPALKFPTKPFGSPTTDAFVALPPTTYVIGDIKAFSQTIAASVPIPEVNVNVCKAPTVIVPIVVSGAQKEPPV